MSPRPPFPTFEGRLRPVSKPLAATYKIQASPRRRPRPKSLAAPSKIQVSTRRRSGPKFERSHEPTNLGTGLRRCDSFENEAALWCTRCEVRSACSFRQPKKYKCLPGPDSDIRGRAPTGCKFGCISMNDETWAPAFAGETLVFCRLPLETWPQAAACPRMFESGAGAIEFLG